MLPKAGKYSKIKKPKTWSWPVKIASPVKRRISPPILDVMDIYFLKFLEKNKNFSIKNPEIINGIAKPKE